jgi:hypothetical protein
MTPRSGVCLLVPVALVAAVGLFPPRAAGSEVASRPAQTLRLTEAVDGDSSAAPGARALARTAPPQWSPYVYDTANRVVLERPTRGSPWSLRLAAERVAAAPASWHVSAVFRNQLLQDLAPRTAYVLRFRARATRRRPVTLELARHHAPYLNLGLAREVVVDQTARVYELAFTTGDSIPPLREPVSSGAWLTVGAGQARGTVWLGDITLEPATPRRFEDRPLSVATFDPGECWGGATAGGRSGELLVSAPANGEGFAWRETSLDLDRGRWDLALRVRASAPRNIGRVEVLLRSGPNDGRAFAAWSFSGLDSGWNRVVIPRERFLSYVWQGHFDWAAVRTVAIKLETNGNGPAEIGLGDLTVEPRAEGRALPPVIGRLAILRLGSTRARITWTTDGPATCALEFGSTPAYGTNRPLPGRSLGHAVELAGLAPGRTYHARVSARSPGGATARSGDFTFATDPLTPWIATRAQQPFPLGLFVVTTMEDLEHAVTTDFSCFISYRFSSCGGPDSEARAYLDTAAAAGKRVLMGLCYQTVARGDTASLLGRVRALAAHRGLLAWYLYDEPEGAGTDPVMLRRVADAIRRADPAHPVVIGSYALGPSYAYRDACDFALVDRYPVPFAPVDSVVPLLRNARASGRDFGFVFQSYSTEVHRWPGTPPGPGRYPSRDEMRAMAWLGVVYGARELWTYAYGYLHDTPGSEWHWADLLSLAHELRLFEPLLLAPEASGVRIASSSSPAIQACVRSLGGSLYVVSVNSGSTRVTASLALAGSAATHATEVFGARGVRCAGGRIADGWPPFGVRIYRLAGPRAAPSLPASGAGRGNRR